jgi:hypothetical protein
MDNVAAMKKILTFKLIIAIRCPTCGAARGEKCELATGLPRGQLRIVTAA